MGATTIPSGRSSALIARIDRETSGIAERVERTISAAAPSLGANDWCELFSLDHYETPRAARRAYERWCREDLGVEPVTNYRMCGTNADPCPCWRIPDFDGPWDWVPREDIEEFTTEPNDDWEIEKLAPWNVSPHLLRG